MTVAVYSAGRTCQAPVVAGRGGNGILSNWYQVGAQGSAKLVSDGITVNPANLATGTRTRIYAGTVSSLDWAQDGTKILLCGPICDTAALVEGLKSGKLAAVGLDVLPPSPISTGPRARAGK